MADLGGRVVGFLEARRAPELADLIVRHHGVPFAAPALRECPQPGAPEVVAAVARLCDGAFDLAIFLTGGGVEATVEGARLLGRERDLLVALSRVGLVARGPKPRAALRRFGLRAALVTSPPHTSELLPDLFGLADLRGSRVLVQLAGVANAPLLDGLAARGADIVAYRPYAWQRPADIGPLLGLLDGLAAGRVHALAGTSSGQIANLFAIARERGAEPQLRASLARVPVAAQGPVTADAFMREGIPVAIVPEHPQLGGLVLAIARYFERAATIAVSAASMVR